MKTMQHEGRAFELDDDGYLAHFEEWTPKIACALAAREEVPKDCPMSEEAQDILKYMRSYYEQFESFPVIVAICRRVNQPRGCVCDHFPDPLVAWKIAGLPKPPAGVVTHMRRHPPDQIN